MLYDQSNYVVSRRSVNLMNSNGTIDESAKIEIQNYDYSSIKFINAGTKKYLIYQDNVCFDDYYDSNENRYIWYDGDGKDYNALNYQKIVYREID